MWANHYTKIWKFALQAQVTSNKCQCRLSVYFCDDEEVNVLDMRYPFSVDPKQSSAEVHRQNNLSEHHFHMMEDCLRDLAGESEGCHCHCHNQECRVDREVDCLVVGFPCAPFSGQRVGRFRSGSATRVKLKSFDLDCLFVSPEEGKLYDVRGAMLCCMVSSILTSSRV
eukprot:4343101-Amphidinium_carterae.2